MTYIRAVRGLFLSTLFALAGCAVANRNLAKGVDSNDLPRVDRALADGADVDALVNGEPAIIDAGMRDRVQLVRLLIQRGANVNIRDGQGMTPLMRIAWLGRTEITQLLIEHGATVDARNYGGETALMAAAAGGRVEVAGLLLSHGANVNAKDVYGRSVLNYGAQFGQPRITRFLLQHGARTETGDKRPPGAVQAVDHPGLPPIRHYLGSDR